MTSPPSGAFPALPPHGAASRNGHTHHTTSHHTASTAPPALTGHLPPPAPQDDVPEAAAVRAIRVAVAARLEQAPPNVQALAGSRASADEIARMRALVQQEVTVWITRRAAVGHDPVSVEAERRLVQAVLAALSGLGGLQELLDRDDVENIHIHGCDRVWVETADGAMQPWPHPVADSDEDLLALLANLASHMGQTSREFSPASPLLNLRLPAGGPLGSRLAAVREVTDRPRVAIRRHRLSDVRLDDLLRYGTIDPLLRDFLTAAVLAGLNIVVTGGPYAGKTTLLRACAHAIPPEEHVVTVEDDFELGLHLIGDHPVVSAFEARLANAEGAGEVTLDDLLKQILRHSPRRVIVGEVRAGEVTSMLRALGNGTSGGMCTLHAKSAGAVFDRIAALAQLAHPPLAVEAAHRWTASAIDLVVHVRKIDHPHHAGGRPRRERFVSEVLEVGPIGDSGLPDTTHVFAPRDSDGRAVPAFAPSPSLVADLRRVGFDATCLTTAPEDTWPHTTTWGDG